MPDDHTTIPVVDLAADDVAATGIKRYGMPGPPYPVRFGLKRGQTWPAVQLLLSIAGQPVAVIDTTEPRLVAALRELLEVVG